MCGDMCAWSEAESARTGRICAGGDEACAEPTEEEGSACSTVGMAYAAAMVPEVETGTGREDDVCCDDEKRDERRSKRERSEPARVEPSLPRVCARSAVFISKTSSTAGRSRCSDAQSETKAARVNPPWRSSGLASVSSPSETRCCRMPRRMRRTSWMNLSRVTSGVRTSRIGDRCSSSVGKWSCDLPSPSSSDGTAMPTRRSARLSSWLCSVPILSTDESAKTSPSISSSTAGTGSSSGPPSRSCSLTSPSSHTLRSSSLSNRMESSCSPSMKAPLSRRMHGVAGPAACAARSAVADASARSSVAVVERPPPKKAGPLLDM
eukprot:4314820-Pleurochrysis_carterae.AAC.1